MKINNNKLVLLFFIIIIAIFSLFLTNNNKNNNDLKIVFKSDKTSFILTNYTDIYPHGAIGSNELPTQINIIKDNKEQTLISLENNQVFETNRIISQDIVGDNAPELLLTISDQKLGAANIIYSEQGEELARSDYIGERFKWRHLLGVIHNQNKQKFLIDVVTPHITGELTLYKVEENKIVPVDSIKGYASHRYGSINLQQAKIEEVDDIEIITLPVFDGEIKQIKVVDEKLIKIN
ncbi:MAG: hypothetical protein OEX81_03500 [Candidatus Pacebacteria bacterium]|nr:hypothetical protein [Candidatus Paceibacterota bacterium]